MLATWKQTSSDSSLIKSSRDEKINDAVRSITSTGSLYIGSYILLYKKGPQKHLKVFALIRKLGLVKTNSILFLLN